MCFTATKRYSMNSLTEKQKDELCTLGRLGFSYKEVALNFGFDVAEVAVMEATPNATARRPSFSWSRCGWPRDPF